MEKDGKQFTRAVRYALQLLGRITLERPRHGEKDSFLCNTLNISLTGAFVETGAALPLGALLKYTFSLPGFKIPLNVTGEIVRTECCRPERLQELPGKKFASVQRRFNRYGIMFLDLREDDRRAMENFLLQKRDCSYNKEAEAGKTGPK